MFSHIALDNLVFCSFSKADVASTSDFLTCLTSLFLHQTTKLALHFLSYSGIKIILTCRNICFPLSLWQALNVDVTIILFCFATSVMTSEALKA